MRSGTQSWINRVDWSRIAAHALLVFSPCEWARSARFLPAPIASRDSLSNLGGYMHSTRARR